jgi:hypothetical protein
VFQRCCIQIEKLDKLIFINKNWPFDLWISCVKSTNLTFTCELELNLMVELEAKFHDDVVDHNDFLDLISFFILLCIEWLMTNGPTCVVY